jgi:hypothetical protein
LTLRHAKPQDLNLIRHALRHVHPHLIHTIERSDTMPESHLFRIIDKSGDAHQFYLVPLQEKHCLDLGIRCWQSVCEQLAPVPEPVRNVTVESGADGRHVYIRTPFRKYYSFAAAKKRMTQEQRFCLAVDLCNTLYWLHRQPLDMNCRTAEAEPFVHEQLLWQMCDRHRTLRSAVNKLMRIADTAEPKYLSGSETPVFSRHAADNLTVDLHHVLYFMHPPYICKGDPWLDLARHLLVINGKRPLLRELIINTYFNLTPPIAFFNTLFLVELEKICLMWKKRSAGEPTMTNTILEFAAQYDAPSPIPVWYTQPVPD